MPINLPVLRINISYLAEVKILERKYSLKILVNSDLAWDMKSHIMCPLACQEIVNFENISDNSYY